MTINLDDEIVSTGYNPVTRMNYYTIERDGKRWTVAIHSDYLNDYGPTGPDVAGEASKRKRREHLANALTQVMQGPQDG